MTDIAESSVAASVGFDSDSEVSDTSEDEDLYSSESDIATELSSRVQSRTNIRNYGNTEELNEDNRPMSVPGMGLTSESKTNPQLSKQEVIRQIYLRRHIDELKKGVEDKNHKVEQCRTQLGSCRELLNSLLAQETALKAKITDHDGSEVKGHSLGLHKSQLAKVWAEISAEENLEISIETELQRAELELSEVEKAAGKFAEIEADLVRGEAAVKDMKMRQAAMRIQKESKLVVAAGRTKKIKEKTMDTTLRSQEKETAQMVEKARQTQEKGKQFLHETLERRRQEDVIEGDKHRSYLDKRIKTMLSLKKNIESSQSTIQAQHMLKSKTLKKKHAQDSRERERILLEGGNPDETLLRRQRIESFDLNKKSFLKQQNERHVDIINLLLEEEEIRKKNEKKLLKPQWHERQKYSYPSKSKSLSTKKKRTKRDSVDISEADGSDKKASGNETSTKTARTDEDHLKIVTNDDLSLDEDEIGRKGRTKTLKSADEEGTESLAEPEIRGLWDQTESSRNVEGDTTGRYKTKSELEMTRNALNRLAKTNVIKQVAAGREFKGQAFYSKPSEVIFQDFELGRVYSKKLQLTNNSYTFNYCKFTGVTDNLKYFVSVKFNPPGSISAGLTCRMVVTFEPKLDEDIIGDIEMLSQTGPFTIPVKCLKKKCLVSADVTEVDFGKVCVGETVCKKITLTNKGALSTKFTFTPKAMVQVPPPLLQVQQPKLVELIDQGSVSQLSDKSAALSIMSNVETRPSQMGMVTVCMDEGISRSTGDLSCTSQKSLSWMGKEQKVDQSTLASDETEDNPANKDPNQDRDGSNDMPLDKEMEHSQQEKRDMAADSDPALQISETAIPSILTREVTERTIEPFSSCSVDIIFSPEVALDQSTEFIADFSHPSVAPIIISAHGCGVDHPVWVERERLDLRVCMVDRLYQDSVILHNRIPTALHMTFKVPRALQPHLEVQPKHGMVQGESSYSAQLKFLPKCSILDGSCEKFFTEGGGLEMPVAVHVIDQSRPVNFTVSAQVTYSDITFDKDRIEFGLCTIHESVFTTLELTNTSSLPQSFGFIELPSYVDVQPGDGFGELLPFETVTLDVIFSAEIPQEYSFVLLVRTAINKTYKIACNGTGIQPALQLSNNVISFAATALDNTSTATLAVHNPKISKLSSAVIRGVLLPQGPKMFEFAVPAGCPVTVSPQVGKVPLGESVNVQVLFSPNLNSEHIKDEASKLVNEEMVQKTVEAAKIAEAQAEIEQQQLSKKKGKKQESIPKPSLLPASSNNSPSNISQMKQAGRSSKEFVELESPCEGSKVWCQVYNSLLSSYVNSCEKFSIPCFVSSETSAITTPPHRSEDTLYLETICPVVRPALIVVSDGGKTTIDFNSVGTGNTKTKIATIKNISDHLLHLKSSILDPHGPFEVRNALRDVSPGATFNLNLRFLPSSEEKYCEHLKIFYATPYLQLKLSGTGIKPDISLSLETGYLDVGHVMVGDRVIRSLELKNSCPLSVTYKVYLENLLPKAMEKRKKKGLPFRARNFSGQPPFTCLVFEGAVEGDGGCSEISVSFAPDHESMLYADTMYIDLNGKHAHTVQLRGRAWTNNMYILANDISFNQEWSQRISHLAQSNLEESMMAVPSIPDGHTIPPKPIVLLFVHHLSCAGHQRSHGSNSKTNDSLKGSDCIPKVVEKVQIGCIKTSLVKKASGDYSIEALPSSNPHSKLFSINPIKSTVEAGTSKTVEFTFTPPKDMAAQTVMEASTNLVLKGDSSQTYRLLLRGLISL